MCNRYWRKQIHTVLTTVSYDYSVSGLVESFGVPRTTHLTTLGEVKV